MQSRINGFTLIEVLVVFAVISITTSIMVKNFSASRIYLREMANIIVADVRGVQQQAIAGSTFQGVLRCGYGIGYVDSTRYRTYAGPQPAAGNTFCTNYNRNFTSSGSNADIVIETKSVIYPNLELKNSSDFEDIFFEPPDLKTYVDDDSDFDEDPSEITIGRVGQSCTSTTCRTVCVYTTGAINVVNGSSCP